jgi:hypothetical protein
MTKKELRKIAKGIAESHFYSDDDCVEPWSPFEDYSRQWIKQNCKDLENTIYFNLVRIQETL